jgi:hypothetical protein
MTSVALCWYLPWSCVGISRGRYESTSRMSDGGLLAIVTSLASTSRMSDGGLLAIRMMDIRGRFGTEWVCTSGTTPSAR